MMCAVGINLLREGLDIPEVSWWPFWMQIMKLSALRIVPSSRPPAEPPKCGRHGHPLCNRTTESMRRRMDEMERRRQIQLAYNADITSPRRPSRKNYRYSCRIQRTPPKLRPMDFVMEPRSS